MSDATPGQAKAIAAGLSGAVVIVIAWVADAFYHISIPIEVAAAIQTIISTVAVFFTPHQLGNSQ